VFVSSRETLSTSETLGHEALASRSTVGFSLTRKLTAAALAAAQEPRWTSFDDRWRLDRRDNHTSSVVQLAVER